MTFEFNCDNLIQRICDIERLEAEASNLREELQKPLEKLLSEAGFGSFRFGEKITSLWETSEGGLHISTEQLHDEFDTNSYTIPGYIIKAADPMAAATEYKRKKASEEDDKRRARTLAEIERLKRTL